MICVKCRKDKNTVPYGQYPYYYICLECGDLWSKFLTPYKRKFDSARRKSNKKFHEVWDGVFQKFLNEKEKVQFT